MTGTDDPSRERRVARFLKVKDPAEFAFRVLDDLITPVNNLREDISALVKDGRVGTRYWVALDNELIFVKCDYLDQADQELQRFFATVQEELQELSDSEDD